MQTCRLHQYRCSEWPAACRTPQLQHPSRWPSRRSGTRHAICSVTERVTEVVSRGASGLDIAGNRPTSRRAWEVLREEVRAKAQFVSPQELQFAQQKGLPVIDVRPLSEYAAGRIPGSKHAQFMRAITGNSARQWARRAAFAFFGILNGTEFNPGFYNEIAALVPDKRKGAVVYCAVGGDLSPLGEGGRQSRSISAAYEMVKLDYKNIKILKGGLSDWIRQERPLEE